MIVPLEMLVEVGDQIAWEVHDALLFRTGSGSEGATKLEIYDEDPPASLSIFPQRSQKNAQEACTGRRGTRHGEMVCSNPGSSGQAHLRGSGELTGGLLCTISLMKIRKTE